MPPTQGAGVLDGPAEVIRVCSAAGGFLERGECLLPLGNPASVLRAPSSSSAVVLTCYRAGRQCGLGRRGPAIVCRADPDPPAL